MDRHQLASGMAKSSPQTLQQLTGYISSCPRIVGAEFRSRLTHDRRSHAVQQVRCAAYDGPRGRGVSVAGDGRAPLIEVHVALRRRQFGPDMPALLVRPELEQLVQATMRSMRCYRARWTRIGWSARRGTCVKCSGARWPQSKILPRGGVARGAFDDEEAGRRTEPADLPRIVGQRPCRDLPAVRLLRLEDLGPAG